MKKKIALYVMILLIFAVFDAGSLTLKLASLLPEGTEWDRNLKSMASDWSDISNGRVKVKIYAGGIAGTEPDVIRKMRFGQIDMAVLTAAGMTAINPDSFALSIPFLLENEDELDFVLDKIAPDFEQGFQDEGFIVLSWAKSGWINIFSRTPVSTPDELRSLKFAASIAQPGIPEAFTQMGFRVVPMDINDFIMGLQSGMIDAFYNAPMAAASYQWFALAPNMMDLKLSPVIGGIIISERAWKKVPDRFHAEMIEAAREMAAGFYSEALQLEQRAVGVMLENGLQINETTPQEAEQWRETMQTGISSIVGPNKLVQPETYSRVLSMLEDFRN